MHRNELQAILTDPDHDWLTRRQRLRGWRGADLDAAVAAHVGTRIGPATCAFGALVGAGIASPVLLGALAVLSAIGIIAPRHPVETVFAAVSRRRGWPVAPPNRAATRSGCVMGTVCLTVATVTIAAGAAGIGRAVAAGLGGLAAFVAATGICVPSMGFTLVFGAERATCPTLAAALAQSSTASRQRAASSGWPA